MDLFTKDLVLFPAPLTMLGEVALSRKDTKHWCLIAIDIAKETVTSYDSLKLRKCPGFFTKILNFLNYLDQEHFNKKGSKIDTK